MRRRFLVNSGAALALVTTATGGAFVGTHGASADTSGGVISAPSQVAAPDASNLTARYTTLPYSAAPSDPKALASASITGTTIPLWNGSDGSTTYTMVGTNPTVASTTIPAAVPTIIVPMAVTFATSGITLDPTAADATCSPAGAALTMTQNSPLFKSASLKVDGVSMAGQYIDTFQRANFAEFTNPWGVTPKYALNLTPTVLAKYSVQANGFPTQAATCGHLGFIDINTWDNFLQSTVFPALASSLTPTTLPVFLTYNVVFYDGTLSNCCIIGYHTAFNNPSHSNLFQSYAVGDYDTSKDFKGLADIGALSHELAEWADDPGVNNTTPPWGNIGQVSGCSTALEVGDPLTGTTVPITLNGFTYHAQDLAFVSWFFGDTPSIGIREKYSLMGTFTKPAAPCSAPA